MAASTSQDKPLNAPASETRQSRRQSMAEKEERKAKDWVSSAGVMKEEFAKSLAGWLVIALVASLVLHYTATVVLIWVGKPTDTLDHIFNSWLPVLSGFVGSAVTYYFTKQKI